MKKLGTFSTAILFLLSGVATPATVAQEPHRPIPRPVPHANPAPAPPQPKPKAPPAQPKPQLPPQETKPVTPPEQPRPRLPEPQPETRPQPSRAVPNAPQAQPRQGAERAARNGSARIPEDRFRASFGPQHRFRIHQSVIVNGQQRFYYASYWFVIVDTWPAYWSWDDDVYVDYLDGGYYLCDPLYPQVLVEVIVV